MLPFCENLDITVGAVLTDAGREFCGKPESHPYELLLAVEGIKHRTTKVRSPRTNCFIERMNRTLLDECFRVQGRTKKYTTPDEIQRDLDTFMAFCNFRRTHQGYYRVAGRTPAKALYDLISEQWFLPPMSDAAQRGAARQLTDRHPRGPGVGEILGLYTPLQYCRRDLAMTTVSRGASPGSPCHAVSIRIQRPAYRPGTENAAMPARPPAFIVTPY